MLFDMKHKVYSSLKSWMGQKKRLPSCKLAVTSYGIFLSPLSIREMQETSLKSWSGCQWKKISPDLVPLEVEVWVRKRPP